MHHIIVRLVLTGMLGMLAAGCAMNPVSGRPEMVLVSEEQETKIGAEEAVRVEKEMGLVQDEEFTRYLTVLGRRLADESPRPGVAYQFHVVDMEEPNAFALPGGPIYVSRGILALANSEDELAGVVGHEIGHVAARHSVQSISKRGPFAIVFGIASGLAGLVSPLVGNIIGGVGDLTQSVLFSPYSRSQESEADRVGQDMAARAGWDPAGLARLLASLDREVKLYEAGKRKPSFFDTHPPTPDRVARTTSHAKDLKKVSRDPISPTPEAFVRRLDGLVVGPRAANGVLKGTSFQHPDLNFAVEFPEGWQVQNNPQKIAAIAKDGEAALFVGAVAKGDDPLEGARILEMNTKQTNILSKTSRTTIGGLPAARTQLPVDGKATIEVTWVAYSGLIYQIAGLATNKQFNAMKPVFDNVANSFRPLSASERSAITEKRIRLFAARPGETIEALIQRTGSTWNKEELAVANALAVTDVLHEGQVIKVAIAEPYLADATRVR